MLGGLTFLMGTLSVMFAMIADLVAYNRQLLEITLERMRKLESSSSLAETAAQPPAAAQEPFPEVAVRRELEALRDQLQAAKAG